jgi:hypothetical protein
MATTGTYTFAPTNADMVDEAYERCGIDPSSLVAKHLISARRSISFLLTHWANRGIRQWKVDRETLTLTASDYDITLPSATQDVLTVVLRRDDVDTELMPMSRTEYLTIPDKTQTGRPDRYFVDKQRDSKTLYIWPSPENSTDEIVYDRLIWAEDTGVATNNPDVPREFFDAFAADLAVRLCIKYSPDRLGMLEQKATEAWVVAMEENRERTDVAIGMRWGR